MPKRFAKAEYWIAKEEREEEEARLEEERRNYEMTDEDIADIRYNEERDERMLYNEQSRKN